MTDLDDRFDSYMRRYSHRNREVEWKVFKAYCQRYPHVDKKFLLNEYEDKSGDLRHLRICSETGDWP